MVDVEGRCRAGAVLDIEIGLVFKNDVEPGLFPETAGREVQFRLQGALFPSEEGPRREAGQAPLMRTRSSS